MRLTANSEKCELVTIFIITICTIIKPERWHLPGRGGGEKTYEISVARNRLRQNNNATVILYV